LTCEVTDRRKLGHGLEVPCKYMLSGPRELVNIMEQRTFSLNAASNILFFSTMAVAVPSPLRRVFAFAAVVAVPLIIMNVINVSFIRGF